MRALHAGSTRYFPVNKMDGPVCQLRQSFIVRHDDKSLPEAVAQIEEEPVKLFLIVRIQTAGRFVGQDHSRMVDKCTGHGLSSRQLIRFMPRTATR